MIQGRVRADDSPAGTFGSDNIDTNLSALEMLVLIAYIALL